MFGSIKSADLDKASIANSQKTAVVDGTRGDGFVDKPVTNVRKIIAKRLLESKQVIFTLLLITIHQHNPYILCLFTDYTPLLFNSRFEPG